MEQISNKSLKLALVGLGRVAEKHLKAIKHLGNTYEIVALVDNNSNRQVEVNEKFELNLNDTNFFQSLEAFYESGLKADVVAIATPSGTHYSLAKLALEHGSHLMVEKPLTLNLEEAYELLELSRNKNLKIAVGHIYRFFPIVDQLQKDIAAGEFGKILAADVIVHWGHDQAYYDQSAWRGTWAQDGGAMMNQTVHALDLMTWLLSSKIVSIQGQIKQLTHKMEAEDYGAALLEMDKDFICRIEGTTNTPDNQQSASFYISTERAEISAGLKKKKPYFSIIKRDGKKLTGKYIRAFLAKAWKNGIKKSINEFSNPHTGIFKDLATAILEDRSPRANGLDGLQSVEAILAIYKSALNDGNSVKLPIEKDFTLEQMQGFFE